MSLASVVEVASGVGDSRGVGEDRRAFWSAGVVAQRRTSVARSGRAPVTSVLQAAHQGASPRRC